MALTTGFGACASPRLPAATEPAAGAGGAGAVSAIPGANVTALAAADPGATVAAGGLDEGSGLAEPAALSTTRVTPDAPFRAQAPAPAPEPVFSAPKFKRFRLKNGINVILSEVHDLPLLELHLVVNTGGGANAPGAAGLADLTANMLDEGTKTRSALEIAEQIGDLGQ